MNLSMEILLLLPEIIMLTFASGILVISAFSRDPLCRTAYYLSQFALALAVLAVLYLWSNETSYAFNNSFIHDPLGGILKITVFVLTSFVFLYSDVYLRQHGWIKGEYFVLGLFAVLGMMIMISSYSLLTLYLGLELLSLSLYAIIAMHRHSQAASEAAMKYFVLGALASGTLLYGMSIIYGVTGSVDLAVIAIAVAGEKDSIVLVFGLVFIVAGLAFKLGAVPFHMWVPDVYQGAPTSVTLFIASAPKLAAFAITIRLLVDGLYPLVNDWQQMLVILAILSMAAGNIIAISQTNIKRMLAYSTIAHIGYMLLGILSSTPSGFAGAMFYIITYTFMALGAFGMVILLGREGFEADQLNHFKGLSQRSPWFAFIMLVLMFSMAGVPPFLGFWAKWFVLKELISAGFIWLAVAALVFSIIGAYYYLRIVRLMYFDQADESQVITAPIQMRFALSINGMVLLLFGLMPGMLFSVCSGALSS